MISVINPIRLSFNKEENTLDVNYSSTSEKTVYDICDLDGRILITGNLSNNKLKIKVSELLNAAYVFLVMDGDNIRIRRFQINR